MLKLGPNFGAKMKFINKIIKINQEYLTLEQLKYGVVYKTHSQYKTIDKLVTPIRVDIDGRSKKMLLWLDRPDQSYTDVYKPGDDEQYVYYTDDIKIILG